MSDAPPAPTATTGDAPAPVDWRETVLQSYRNTEVREISKVLAALEPGATPNSKLMLAMRFEDSIFKAASSLADYKKKITKRLKKLQKNYVPPTDGAATADGAAAAGKEKAEKERQELLLKLQQKWGEQLRYIHKHCDKALAEIRRRLGDERAAQLEQHTKSAYQWAIELGVLEGARKPSSSSSKRPLSKEQLQRLEQHLERRVDNIRTYVVKHAEPDLFLLEALVKQDSELPDKAAMMLGINLRKRVEQLQKHKMNETQLLQTSLEKAATPVPPPTRNQDNDKPASMLHLEKMRAASTVVLAYLSHADRKTTPKDSLTKAHTVATEGVQFIQSYFEKLAKQKEAAEKQRLLQLGISKAKADETAKLLTESCTLQDAWNKAMQLPRTADPDVTTEATGDDRMVTLNDPGTAAASSESADLQMPSASKRRKLGDHASVSRRASVPSIALRARVLLSPNRRVPANLAIAFKRKRAKLVRPPPSGVGTHVVLNFGTAFTMTIYLSPLLVTLRTMTKQEKENVFEAEDRSSHSSEYQGLSSSSSMLNCGVPRLKLLSHGLTDQGDGDGTPLGSSTTTTTTMTPASASSSRSQLRQTQKVAVTRKPSAVGTLSTGLRARSELTVWGVTGSYDAVGHVVEERLRDASMHCTNVLRQCFGSSIKPGRLSDFEIEILEATALLEFLQIARSTYIPGWEDAHVVDA